LCTLFTPEERLEQIEKEKITITIGAPSVWISAIDYIKNQPYDTSSLRVVWTGGGPISLSQVHSIKENICDRVVMVYGMTETSGITTLTKLDDPAEVVATYIGLPLPHFELKIMDMVTGKTLPAGNPGELCVRGLYVIKGYLNMPKEEEAIYFDADGWYHTGDIMIENENGYYSFVGRAKEIIKVGGENVGLNEVDSFLKAHPKVKMAASIGIPDPKKQEVPMVFIETMDGETLTEEEVIAYCKKSMASFKVPRYVRFISEWPLVGIGKVQRFKLWEMVKDEF
jgi:fatty-acyl-CoA synthase